MNNLYTSYLQTYNMRSKHTLILIFKVWTFSYWAIPFYNSTLPFVQRLISLINISQKSQTITQSFNISFWYFFHMSTGRWMKNHNYTKQRKLKKKPAPILSTWLLTCFFLHFLVFCTQSQCRGGREASMTKENNEHTE